MIKSYKVRLEPTKEQGAFMFIKLHLVKDYEVRKVLWQERASTKIKPYLKYKDIDVEVLSFPKGKTRTRGKICKCYGYE
jgi:hypothetical protein